MVLRLNALVRRHMRKNWKLLLAALVLLAVFLYSAVRLAHYTIRSISTRHTNEKVQAIFDVAEDAPEMESPELETSAAEGAPEPLSTPEPKLLDVYQYIGEAIQPKAQKLVEKNPDTVGWLYMSGGIVDLPVVYRDNTYYLDHNFYGQRSTSGTLFLDEKHPFWEDTQYLVIHGHNWYDGNMFGALALYQDKAYMEEHSTVYWYTLYRREEYEVIGVLYVTADVRSEQYVPYVGMRKFQTLDQFYDFAEVIQKNALHWKEGVEMRPNDAFLALSTCYEEDRIVVICRRKDP